MRKGENRHKNHKKWDSKFNKINSAEKRAYNLISIGMISLVLLVYFGQFDSNNPFKPNNPIELLSIELTILGSYAAIMFAISNRFHKFKELQMNGLATIFKLLNTEDIRKARRLIHEEYCRLREKGLPIKFENSEKNMDLKDQVDLALSSFDQVSILVLNKFIDKELFYETYGEMIVRDWKTLEAEISKRQEKNPKTLRHFTHLKDEFENRDDIGDTEPYCI